MAKTDSGVHLQVESREGTGTNHCRRMRAAGMIPGNVYGLGRPPFMVAVDPARLGEVLRLESGVNTVFSLQMSGESGQREAMIKELQRDPITERPIHVDFVRVDPNKMVLVNVPIRLAGIPIGVKLEGGILDFVHREVRVECLPRAIPEHLVVDVSGLHLNQHVEIKDLDLGEGMRILDDPGQTIAVCMTPKAEEEAAAPEEAVEGAAEPEVAKKGKEDEASEGGSGESKK